MIIKKNIKYLILCILAIAIYISYFIFKAIPTTQHQIRGIYELIYLIFFIPFLSTIYGVISYILTNKIIFFNFLFSIIFYIVIYLSFFPPFLIDELLESLPIFAIIFSISIISSIITKIIIIYILKKHQKCLVINLKYIQHSYQIH